MSMMTRLTSIWLVQCQGITELLSIKGLAFLKILHIIECHALLDLPVSINVLKTPASINALTVLHILTLHNLSEFKALPGPASIGALTVLHTLHLHCLLELKALLASIGKLITLSKLKVYQCGLTNVPLSIESLTSLRMLELSEGTHQDSRVFKTLACALPALRLLQRLDLYGVLEDNVLALGRSLKAWPLPLLELITSNWRDASEVHMSFPELLGGAGAQATARGCQLE